MKITLYTFSFWLIVSAGFAQSHSLLKNIGPGNEHGIPTSNYAAELNGKYYFITGAPASSNRIWSTDGTSANTVPVLTNNYSSLDYLFAVEDNLVFSAWATTQGIYKSDGTQAGTMRIADIPQRSVVYMARLNNEKVVFVTENFAEDTTSLWVTDGTSPGTFKLGDFELKADYISHTYFGNNIVFTEKSTNFNLFPPVISDGTIAGSALVTDFINEIVSNDIASVETAVGTGEFLFVTSGSGDKVFNGTSLSNINLSGDFNHGFNVNNLNVVFSDYEILAYDGASGNSTVLPVSPDYFSEPIAHNDKVYFHNDGGSVYETDGTAAGTKKISSNTIGTFNFDPYLFGKEDHLYYSTNLGNNTELWEIDLNTFQDSLFDVIKPAASPILDPFAFGAGPYMVYAKYTPAAGNEMWVYNSLSTGLSNEPLQGAGIFLHPNPARDHVSIRFEINVNQGAEILIYDQDGKIKWATPFQNPEFTFSIGNFTPGRYYITLQEKGMVLARSSFLKI